MSEATPVPGVDRTGLREAIRDEYREVSLNPGKGFHFHTGRDLASIVEYRDEWLEGVPESVIETFAGTGNPFSMGLMQPGERVVDLGCGAGIDTFIAARQVGETGAVIGIDMTPEMLEKARAAVEETGLANVELREGYLEELPVEDGWADVVIANGVVNLCPDKGRVFQEIHRVLRPGGRMQIGDILVGRRVSEEAKRRIDLWTGWIAGALLEGELQSVVESAGFTGFEITWQAPVFDGAPQSSSAAKFGTVGINFRACR